MPHQTNPQHAGPDLAWPWLTSPDQNSVSLSPCFQGDGESPCPARPCLAPPPMPSQDQPYHAATRHVLTDAIRTGKETLTNLQPAENSPCPTRPGPATPHLAKPNLASPWRASPSLAEPCLAGSKTSYSSFTSNLPNFGRQSPSPTIEPACSMKPAISDLFKRLGR